VLRVFATINKRRGRNTVFKAIAICHTEILKMGKTPNDGQ